MARQTYVYDPETGKVIPKAEAIAKQQIHVIGDEIPETQSMVDGKHYTSKSALRAHYRANDVVEVGNDCFTDPDFNTGRTDKERNAAPAAPPTEQGKWIDE